MYLFFHLYIALNNLHSVFNAFHILFPLDFYYQKVRDQYESKNDHP